MTNVSVNKRTMLGGQYWTIAAVSAMNARASPFAVVLAVVGAYLVFWPAFDCSRRDGPFKFLLRAE